MFEPALKRLFLILFPLSLLFLALFLTNQKQSEDNKIKTSYEKKDKKSVLSNTKCLFYLGVSFFPIENIKHSPFKKQKVSPSTLWANYLLSEQNFVHTLRNLKDELKKEQLSLKKILFAFPLALTKEEDWIISKKTFVILPTGERKELSHLTYMEITKLSENFNSKKPWTPLRLKQAFSYLPDDANFLFYLEGSQREKIIKNLKQSLKNKTKGDVFLSSSNEKLLKEILTLDLEWPVLHSFKALVRLQIMSLFKSLLGQGVIIPSVFTPSLHSLTWLKNQKKLLFFEKDPPYNLASQDLIQRAQALISFQPKLALSSIKVKKPCLMND